MAKRITGWIGLLLCVFLCSCTTYNDSADVNGVYVGYSKLFQNYFIGGVSYEKGEDPRIVLPSVYEGHTINELGGYIGTGVPTPFSIVFEGEDWFPDAPDEWYTTMEEYLYTDFFEGYEVKVEDICFQITLPSGLERIKNLRCDDILCGEVTAEKLVYVLRPVYYFEIAESNEYFYTQEGRLYDKQTKAPVQGIVYQEFPKIG